MRSDSGFLVPLLLAMMASSAVATGTVANATLTCEPGCNASLNRIEITKDGLVIGQIIALSCDAEQQGGNPTSTSVKLTDSPANDLSIGPSFIQCSDTPVGVTGCDFDIAPNQEPWGVNFNINNVGTTTCTVIGMSGPTPLALAASLEFEFEFEDTFFFDGFESSDTMAW